MTRVLLADDHTMIRQSLRRALTEKGIEVVGEAGDGDEAARLAIELSPDVVVMDVSMPVLDGVQATRVIRDRAPSVQVLILTMHADKGVFDRAMRAGAVGYMVKDCTMEEIVRTVQQAAAGETALSAELAGAMLAEAAHPQAESIITKREEEVLQLIADGLSTPEVADRLFISVKTVKNHLASVYQKLDSRDRVQAVVRAVKMGIIRLEVDIPPPEGP